MAILQTLNAGVVLKECDRNFLRGEMLWKKKKHILLTFMHKVKQKFA
jgi:hypothetical protein